MERPVERPEGRHFVKLPTSQGSYQLEKTHWRFDEQSPNVLALDQLNIKVGQHWVLLGGNGAVNLRCCVCWQDYMIRYQAVCCLMIRS